MPATSPKHFGSKTGARPPDPVEFSVEFLRDGEPETHVFTARPRLSYGDTAGLVAHQDEAGKLFPVFDRFIRQSLVNSDGVKARWAPQVRDGKFYAPDGSETPEADLPAFTAFDAGSSRRRWMALTAEDNEDVTVEIEQVVGVFEFLTSSAGGTRPT